MTDFRELCAELADALDYHQQQTRPIFRSQEVLARARTALEQLPEGPAVTPDDARGLGSVADSVEATDEDLTAAASQALDGYKYASELPYFLAPDATEHEPLMLMLRAIYDLGYEHGAATQEHEQEGPAVTPAPAPAPAKADDEPLWRLIHMSNIAHDGFQSVAQSNANALRVVADWLERRWPQGPDMHPCVCATWLRAEAERAEAGEP